MSNEEFPPPPSHNATIVVAKPDVQAAVEGAVRLPMSGASFGEALFQKGYTNLISVIPPGAQLSPGSKIPANMVGKIPGRRSANGTWSGWNWRKHVTTIDDVKRWTITDHASLGLRSDFFPGVDIDCTDPSLSKIIADFMLEKLGPAPVRVGRAPKQLLMYKTEQGFGRMRLWIKTKTGEQHLVEILGVGQQYLVSGLHPTTHLPYRWLSDVPDAKDLTLITREQADAALNDLEHMLNSLDLGLCSREADGRSTERGNVAQNNLLAPSVDHVRQAVALIPNDDTVFPDRTSYLKMGYAIKAAVGDDSDDDGFEIFAEWCARWDGGYNEPDVVLADWRRMNGAKSVGWNWIAEVARGYGYNDAVDDFEVLEDSPTESKLVAPQFSDQGLATSVIHRHGDSIKFVPETGRWLVWDGTRWGEDTSLHAEDIIKRALRDVGAVLMTQGVTDKEIAINQRLAKSICSASKLKAVSQLVRSDRAIVVLVDSLDSDPWLLNTPAGIIDLKTGKLGPSRAEALMTKSTAVEPDFVAECSVWKRFLAETTGGDAALEAYLQRFAGYCLTGSTKEQQLTFLFGPGGNGKSVFLTTLSAVMGDYSCTAPMDAFTASNGDRHSTEIAMFVGTRLVTASETNAGRSWDEARVKSLTGGEPVTARFMRQDNFTYMPSFKLLFAGNHKPNLRDVDAAMQRRLHMVPFMQIPARVDPDLPEKLRRESPAILAWMIEGALAWQREGLNPPAAVAAMTTDYLNEQDLVGAWLKECCDVDDDKKTFATIRDLFASWRTYSSILGEQAGTDRQLAQALANHGFVRGEHPRSRRHGFKGLSVRPVDMADGFGQVA